MNLSFYKKIFIGFVLTSLVFSPGLFSIQKANAQIAGSGILSTREIETSPLTIVAKAQLTTANAAAAKQSAKDLHDTQVAWTDRLLKLAGQALKKLVLDRLVDATTQWIMRGGFEGTGGPVVADWGAFFQQAGEEAVGMVAQQELPWLCAPIRLNVAFSLFAPATFSTQPATACTLNTIVDDIDNLFKTFNKQSKGRWITYNTLWEPQNNFFGTAIATEDQKESALAKTLQAKQIDATINAGFKSQTQCTVNAETGVKTCKTLTPGNQIAQAVWDTSTSQKKIAGIISADDAASYIGALLDAVIYRYSLLAVGGIAGAYNANDSQAGTAFATYQGTVFNQINSMIFKNDQTMFNETFNSVLGIKQNTVLAINQSSNIETSLKNKLITLQMPNCNLSNTTLNGNAQAQDLIAEIPVYISDIDATLESLAQEKAPIDQDIKTVQDTQSNFNKLDPKDSASENIMVATYNGLVNDGTLNTQTANQALANAQAELTSIKDNSDNLLQTASSSGGYQDIISACANQTVATSTPAVP